MTIDHRACRRFRLGDFTLPGAESHYPPDLEIEPTHLDVELAFDIPGRSVQGAVTNTVRANRKDSRTLVLHAMDFRDVEVTDADGKELAFRYDGRRIRVTWADPFDEGEERRVRVAYSVVRPISGISFSVPDEHHPDRAHWAASDHETERARYWLPCVDLPAVRTTLAFHLTADGAHTILANGSLGSETENDDGTKTAHWRLDFPCPSYLICVAVGELVRTDDESVDGRPIAYFGAKGRVTPEDLMRSFGRTPAIMRWLERRLGVPFPFPKYFQFALPQIGGAMENISLTSWDDIFVTDEVLHQDLGELTDIINVHEMAHSYFGDAVVIRDFAHAWLKESWATYLETCWYFEERSEDEGRYNLVQDGRSYMKEADERYARPIVTRVFDSSWKMYDMHIYPGGACRLHMLRKQIGEEPFWRAVTEYVETYSGKLVETEDFRRLLEKHSGLSLVRFFDQWFYGRGYPKLKMTFEHDEEKGRAVFTVEQTQVPEAPVKEADAANAKTLFTFPLTIAWEDAGGAWESRDFEVTERKHTFVTAMAEAPQQIRVDPDQALLFGLDFNPGDEMLRRAVRHSPDVGGRIAAADELAKTGKEQNLDAVAEAFREEGFWGVRREMAKAIVNSRSACAIRILGGILREEKDARVLWTAVTGSGAYRDERIAEALVDVLDGETTYYVRSAALMSLGGQRGEAHLERIGAAAGDTGYRHFVRAGALRALAETRTEVAFEKLLTCVDYAAEPDDTAHVAAESLAACGRFLSRRHRDAASETLRDALRDPRWRVPFAAASGLGSLRAVEAIPDLERALDSIPEQDHPTIRRVIRGLKSGEESAAAALTKRLEEVEAKNRKLEERLDRLEAEGRA